MGINFPKRDKKAGLGGLVPFLFRGGGEVLISELAKISVNSRNKGTES